MSQKPPQQPDRANDNDLDDIDVPTFRGSSAQSGQGAGAGETGSSAASARWYERAGRAAPQSIPPTTQQPPVSREETPTTLSGSTAAETGSTPTTSFSTPTGGAGSTGSTGATGSAGSTAATGSAGATGATGAAGATAASRDSYYPLTDARSADNSYADEVFAPTGGVPVQNPNYQQDYAATGAAGAPVAADPAVAGATHAEDDAPVERERTRRGTIDLGIFIVRLGLAAWLILESLGTFFRLGGNEGLAGLETDFAAYLYPSILALAVPTAQLAAGLFLLFGLVTPLFAAVATVVTGFTALHTLASSGAGLDIFAWPEGVWLSIILLVISVALQFTGPGLYSLDFGRGWARRPLASSWIFIVLAIAGVAAVWWFGTGINPFA